MKNLLFVLLAFFTTSQLYSQWYPVNSGTTEHLYDIVFYDSLVGYCVGGGADGSSISQSTGVVLKTSDGGETWSTVFSKDSLKIKSVGIIQEGENTKLYAFSYTKDGVYLMSSIINSPLQNWSFSPVNYKLSMISFRNNSIFYIDYLSNELKRITNSVVSNLGVVEIYGVSSDALIAIKSWSVDGLYYSPTFDTNFVSVNNHNYYSVFGQNQSTNATIKKNGDTLILKGTYSSVVVYSLDNGNTWQHNYGGGGGKSIITESSHIISLHLNSNYIFSSNDFGQNWEDTIINGVEFTSLGYSEYNNTAFALGNNGVIYKNSNLNTVGTNDVELKKNIKIFPNPTSSFIELVPNDNVQIDEISITDFNGRLVISFDKSLRKLPVKNLAKGIYLLNISTPEGVITERIVVE